MQRRLKKVPILLVAYLLIAQLGVTASHANTLRVTNGDFADLTGLTDQSGGWYQGAPTGWTSSAGAPGYTVSSGQGNTPPVANLGQLSTLRQNIGTPSVPSRVTVTFDIGVFWAGQTATVSITDGGNTVYGSKISSVGNRQTLAADTPAGVPIYIEFGGGQQAWVDNVSVSSVPATQGLNLTNGNFANTTSMTETDGGWLGGLPVGWSTTAPASGYAVYQSGGVNYANLSKLGQSTSGFTPLRQNLGTVSAVSDVTISFKATSLNAYPYNLASAIYSTTDEVQPLGLFQTPALIQGPTTITYSVRNVPAGTQLFVAFWTQDGFAPGITDVAVSTTSSVPAGIALSSGAVLNLDPAQPVNSSLNFDFAPGSKIKVVGSSPLTGSAVRLLYTSGGVSGSPVLETAMSGYELALGSGNLLWLRKGLTIYNGDFQDTLGLTGPVGSWYGGVPVGWSAQNGDYSVADWYSGNLGANLRTLGPAGSTFFTLYQSAGILDSAGTVTLTFDIINLGNSFNLGAAIYQAPAGGSPGTTWTTLVNASYALTDVTGENGITKTLQAIDVPANTPIAIAFWSPDGVLVDNVRVASEQPPTPLESYLASFGLSEDDLLGTADHDGDGMDNNAEFAFGTSPISGASRATTLTSGTGEIILTYLQRKTGVTYTVKSLPNLTTPFNSGTPVTPSLSNNQGNLPSDDYERYEAKLRTDSSRGFLQVKAVVP